MNQAALFDPEPRHCPVPGCGAILLPNQDRVITCHHDLQPDQTERRPKACLNTYNPAKAPIPY